MGKRCGQAVPIGASTHPSLLVLRAATSEGQSAYQSEVVKAAKQACRVYTDAEDEHRPAMGQRRGQQLEGNRTVSADRDGIGARAGTVS